jgi:hypothetical protein
MPANRISLTAFCAFRKGKKANRGRGDDCFAANCAGAATDSSWPVSDLQPKGPSRPVPVGRHFKKQTFRTGMPANELYRRASDLSIAVDRTGVG